MDTYGASTIPLTVPTDPDTEAVSDPALDVWCAYLKAYINAKGGAAWAKVFPRFKVNAPLVPIPPVYTTRTHQPTDESIAPFNETWLPALFLYRAGGGEPKWEEADARISKDIVTLLWVFPTGAQAADRIRVPYVNGLVKLIDAAIEAQLDPVYVHPSDTDPKAATLAADTDAIKLSVATSTLSQTYTGAALDGIIGSTAFIQPRAFTATLTNAAAFIDGSTITITGKDVLSNTLTRVITISTAGIPGTFASDYAFTEIDSITIQAQASGAGLVEFGLGTYQGRGSHLFKFAPFGLKRSGNWKAQPIVIDAQNTGTNVPVKRYYDAVEMSLEISEIWTRDKSLLPALAGMDSTISANQAGWQVQNQVTAP